VNWWRVAHPTCYVACPSDDSESSPTTAESGLLLEADKEHVPSVRQKDLGEHKCAGLPTSPLPAEVYCTIKYRLQLGSLKHVGGILAACPWQWHRSLPGPPSASTADGHNFRLNAEAVQFWRSSLTRIPRRSGLTITQYVSSIIPVVVLYGTMDTTLYGVRVLRIPLLSKPSRAYELGELPLRVNSATTLCGFRVRLVLGADSSICHMYSAASITVPTEPIAKVTIVNLSATIVHWREAGIYPCRLRGPKSMTLHSRRDCSMAEKMWN
jgi:hypothetical protein